MPKTKNFPTNSELVRIVWLQVIGSTLNSSHKQGAFVRKVWAVDSGREMWLEAGLGMQLPLSFISFLCTVSSHCRKAAQKWVSEEVLLWYVGGLRSTAIHQDLLES